MNKIRDKIVEINGILKIIRVYFEKLYFKRIENLEEIIFKFIGFIKIKLRI